MMPTSTRQQRRYEQHLTDAELNELVDGTLPTQELDRAQTHLSTCAECEERYRTLQATISALQSAPSLMPRRTFQLTPQQAPGQETKNTRLDRFAQRILPGVPALRAATLLVALLFISVTAVDIVTHRDTATETTAPDPALMQQAAEQESTIFRSAPESTAGIFAANEAPAAAPPLDETVNEPTTADGNDAGDRDTTDINPPTATPSTDERNPGGTSISPWRIAELGLFLLLLWLGVSWFGRTGLDNGDETDDSTQSQ